MLDDELLEILAEKLAGKRVTPRNTLITLVHEREGVPRRLVLDQYPLNEVIDQLNQYADLWRCSECTAWTPEADLVEHKGERVCFKCRPDLGKRAAPDEYPRVLLDEDDVEEPEDYAEERDLQEELRAFTAHDDDDPPPTDAQLSIVREG